jgi:hypothetical protein
MLGLAAVAAVGATLGLAAGPASAGVSRIGGTDMLVTGGDCGHCDSNRCSTFAHYRCHEVLDFCREKKSEPVSAAHCAQGGDTGCKLSNPILCATIYNHCDCATVSETVTCSDCDVDEDYRPKDCEPTKK